MCIGRFLLFSLTFRWPKLLLPASLYIAAPFAVGFWEAQVNKLNRELVEDFEEYFPSLIDASAWDKTPQLRTIPVEKSITIQPEVMPYERVEEIVRTNKTFAVSNCICRQEQHILGKGCDKPEESCMQFGVVARSVVLRSLKRYPVPASVVATPFFLSLNADTCKGCGLCTKRCQSHLSHWLAWANRGGLTGGLDWCDS